MQDLPEQITLYIRDIWRYRWYAMAVAWLIVLVGLVAVSFKPVIYTASAKIYVDTYTVLQHLLKGLAIDKDTGAYIGLMARQLVSRPNLEQVAHTVGLDRQAKSPQDLDVLLAKLGADVGVDGSRASEGAKQRDFYVIYYRNRDPKLARQVVEALITTFAEKTVKESLRDSEAAKQFLEQQIKEQQEKLITAETRVREFKRAHIDELPGTGENYFQRLQAVQGAIDDVTLQIKVAMQRRSDFQGQLAKVSETLQGASIPVGSSAPVESRLQGQRRRLDELLTKYTESHPDVIAVRRNIAELEKHGGVNERGLNNTTTRHYSSTFIPNPVYQQIKTTLSQLESEIAGLEVRKEEYLRRFQSLRGQTESMTQVEEELQRLTHDYENTKQQYDALVGRQGSLAIAGDVDQSGENVRFKIIDPPRVQDTWPTIASSQWKLTIGVLAASFAGGLGVAFALSQLWPVVYSLRTLNELTGIPVFGTISQTLTPQVRQRRLVELGVFLLVGIMMVATYGTAVFFHFKHIKDIFLGLGGTA